MRLTPGQMYATTRNNKHVIGLAGKFFLKFAFKIVIFCQTVKEDAFDKKSKTLRPGQRNDRGM